MNRLSLLLLPIGVLVFCFLFFKTTPPTLDTNGDVSPEQLDANIILWNQLVQQDEMVSILERERLLDQLEYAMKNGVNLNPSMEEHFGNDIVASVCEKEEISEAIKQSAISTVFNLLYGLGTGSWNEYVQARLPANNFEIIKESENASLLGETLGLSKADIDKKPFTKLHEEWFISTFSKFPYINSVQCWKTNAFVFTKWSKPSVLYSGWKTLPKAEGGMFAYEFRNSYSFRKLQEKLLDQEELHCSFCFMAEGNPKGVIRPSRVDMYWSPAIKKWVPFLYVRAFADYKDPPDSYLYVF